MMKFTLCLVLLVSIVSICEVDAWWGRRRRSCSCSCSSFFAAAGCEMPNRKGRSVEVHLDEPEGENEIQLQQVDTVQRVKRGCSCQVTCNLMMQQAGCTPKRTGRDVDDTNE